MYLCATSSGNALRIHWFHLLIPCWFAVRTTQHLCGEAHEPALEEKEDESAENDSKKKKDDPTLNRLLNKLGARN